MTLLTKIVLAAGLIAVSEACIAQSSYREIKDTAYAVAEREVSGFHDIRIQGPFNVFITQGDKESLKIAAPPEVLNDIKTYIDNGTLNVHHKMDFWPWDDNSVFNRWNWWNHNNRVNVYITAKNLNEVSISGSGQVLFKEGITASELELKTSGSGTIEGKIDVHSLVSHISGEGHVNVHGNAGTSHVHISGSGRFSGKDLITSNSTVRISGSGHAEVNASNELTAAVSGSSNVSYVGSPKTVNASKSGSGVVHSM